MIILIGGLTFISLALLFYAVYPFMEQKSQSWHKKRLGKFTPKLDNMFIYIPSRKLLIIDIGFPLAAGVLVFFLTQRLLPAAAAVAIGLIIVTFIIKRLEIVRKRKFASQLVDGLMLLSGSLKAGLSLLQAIEALAEEMPAPISQEFSLVLRENRLGVPLEDCLAKLKRRMDCDDLNMIVTAILVARETGGNLTTVFSNLVMTIRERERLLGKVKALCVQGKLQGRIMMFLPIVFAYGVYKFDPNFFKVLMDDPVGRMLLIYAVVSEIIGMFLINRLSRIEI